MPKKQSKPTTEAENKTLAIVRKSARVLAKRKRKKTAKVSKKDDKRPLSWKEHGDVKEKQKIIATQSQWELVNDIDTKLSMKHLMFVLEYCVDYNATRAYKEVYKCSDEVANAKGPVLVVKDSIQEAIAKYMRPKIEVLWLWAERRLKTLQSVVNKCLQIEPITQIIRYERIKTYTDEDWEEVTTRDTQYREEQVKGPFQPASVISAVNSITDLLKVETPKDKEVKQITEKQQAAILALGNAFKKPEAE